MSLLDDARRLADVGPALSEDTFCCLCYEQVESFGTNPVFPGKPHKTTCPALSFPRIVAALEAAESVKRAFEEQGVADADVLLEVGNLVRVLRDQKVTL